MTSSDETGGDPSPETECLSTSPLSSSADRARAVSVLDEPLDDQDLESQIRRPGMSGSTKVLLALLAAVVVFGLGALLGRLTAPDTGPGSSPDVVGAVESVGAGGSQLTVRAPDGGLVVLSTTPGTAVGTARPDGVGGLRPGDRVTVGAEVNGLGSLDATRVEVTPPR